MRKTVVSRMNNCPDSTIAAGAWYEYFPCTRGIYSISLPCHVCISFDLLDHPCWRSDSYRGVLNISRHHRTGTNCDIISYHHTKQDYTIFSAIISNSDISRIAYATSSPSFSVGWLLRRYSYLDQTSSCQGVGHSEDCNFLWGVEVNCASSHL